MHYKGDGGWGKGGGSVWIGKLSHTFDLAFSTFNPFNGSKK